MIKSRNDSMPPELRERLDKARREERDSLAAVWKLLGAAQPRSEVSADADAMWAELDRRTAGNAGPSLPRRDRAPVSSISRRKSGLAAAVKWPAAIILALCLGLAAFLWWSTPVRIAAPPGERTAVILPDGSSVQLGGGSAITYRRGFGSVPVLLEQQRAVALEGEAFFEVTAGEGLFVVETFNARIEVHGTRFDVQAWPLAEQPETLITLEAGVVRVAATRIESAPVTLQESGHTSRVIGMQAAPSPPQLTDADQVFAWREHGFFASDQPLSDILRRLEQRFGTRIVLQVSSVASDYMTLYYPQHVDLETILHDICTAKGLKYRQTSRGYEIVEERSTTRTDRT